MPTPAERKALLFLAGVIVLGASVRVVRAARDDGSADAASRAALARQLAAVDSAHESEAETASRKGVTKRRPGPARRGRARPNGSTMLDSASGSAREGIGSRSAAQGGQATQGTPVLPVDLDVASATDIESLPRIGPVLARRIVEDRDRHGAFGSLEGFERVRGVGPSLSRTLRARVTFSGTARPSNAVVDQGLRSLSPPAKPPRRRREK